VILAVTGATGFVGGAVLAQAVAEGHQVRALARRPQPARAGVTWIAGDLANPGDLCVGADAVIHVAGVVNAPDRAGFAEGNLAGTQAVLAAAARAGVARFVHVSSLAAREPGLSDYGWSKAEAERLVAASDRTWTIVRPPAVYGPGDLDQRDLFRMSRLGLAIMPPPGRMSAIHVEDLARLLLALAAAPADGAIHEAEGPDGPMTHGAYFAAIGAAVGRRVLPLPLPAGVLRLAARIDRLLRGDKARLTPDRVAYMVHPDWAADPDKAPPAALWQPRIPLAQGLAATAAWYRANGLL
jgi:nucleoside-diphosphate-sugar epimerase